MNDHELLEMAAKAMELREDSGYQKWWNPLDDDGAAFRLACRLRLDLAWQHASGYIEVYRSCDIKFPSIMELYVGNVDSSTRRAIVRAAAEIGKSMP